MALVQTHCFNWMGYEGTMSETLNLALLRHSDMGNLRYSDYRQRQEVVADIRMRLKIIKRELGLLPPEEDIEVDDTADYLSRDLLARMEQEEENEFVSRLDKRRKKLLKLEGIVATAESEDCVYYHPGVPTAKVQESAVPSFALAVRALLVHAGETFISYLDGREFVELSELTEHNNARRGEVEAAVAEAGVVIPAESEFDVSPLQAALEKRQQLRMKIDALRSARDPEYAARFVRVSERNNGGEAVEDAADESQEAKLSAKLKAATAHLESVRLAYNKKAFVVSRRVQRVFANQAPLAEL